MFHYFESATVYLTKSYLYGFQFLAYADNAAVNILYLYRRTFVKGSDAQGALPPPAAGHLLGTC